MTLATRSKPLTALSVSTAIVMVLGMASTALAQQDMFKLAEANSLAAPKLSKAQPNSQRFQRQFADQALSDDSYYIDLPGKRVLVNRLQVMPSDSAPAGAASMSASKSEIFYFDGQRGFIDIQRSGGDISGALVHDVEAGQAFRGAMVNGVMQFAEMNIDELICVNYAPAAVEPQLAAAAIDLVDNSEAVSEATVRSLESRPGAMHTVYIDYWGGQLRGTAWNSGNTAINYEPYNSQGDSSTFTQRELEIMYVAWAEMAEDYAPFDVNITTDPAVFNSYQPRFRSRIIASPTNVAAPGSGGVAYVNVFGSNSDFYTVGWTFNASFATMGMTHSHEAGHQMGLSHDGGSANPSYYSGHNNWGPIMGAPFGKDYVQWSKGEYAGANQQQDDLAIVLNKLKQVKDDAGDNNATAEILDISGADFIGMIRPQGLGKDTDVFLLEQGGTSTVDISVRPALEGLAQGNNFGRGTGPNLSLRAVLRKSNGSVIDQVAPTNNATTNQLTISQELEPGKYYLTIDNESPNSNPSTGFNEYGNGGFYQVDVSGGIDAEDSTLCIPITTKSNAVAMICL